MVEWSRGVAWCGCRAALLLLWLPRGLPGIDESRGEGEFAGERREGGRDLSTDRGAWGPGGGGVALSLRWFPSTRQRASTSSISKIKSQNQAAPAPHEKRQRGSPPSSTQFITIYKLTPLLLPRKTPT